VISGYVEENLHLEPGHREVFVPVDFCFGETCLKTAGGRAASSVFQFWWVIAHLNRFPKRIPLCSGW